MEENRILSKDGKLCVKYTDIRHVCICYSLYPLFQYLLLFDEDTTMHHTCYFLGSGGISQDVSDRLPAFYFDTKPCKSKKEKFARIIHKLLLRFSRNRRYPFLKSSKIFAQDYGYLSILIGNNTYSMLAEASDHLTSVYDEDGKWYKNYLRKVNSFSGRIERLLYGNLATYIHGDNDQCVSFYLTEKNYARVLEGKEVHVNTLSDMWEQSNERKQQFVMSVFGVKPEDMRSLNNKKIWFFTQPLVHDRWYTEKDYFEIIREVLEHYDETDVLIKTHPRDDFNYRKYFPNIEVYSKPVSMELLVFMGVQIERAVTLFSTAVDLLPDSVQIDWFGIPQRNLLIDGLRAPFPFKRSYNQMYWKNEYPICHR